MDKNKIHCGDCLELISKMPDKYVDITITDPPYGINFRSNYRKVKHKEIQNDDEFPIEFLEELFRVTRNAVYVFCRWDNLKDMPKPKSVIAWVKNNWSMGDLEHEHGRQWEAIAFYPMTSHKFIKRIPDVIMCNRTGNNLHPTQKPVDLIRKLIKSNQGNLILDPFVGSGTTMIACKQLDRDFIGIEIDEEYCKIANKRLEQGILKPMLLTGSNEVKNET